MKKSKTSRISGLGSVFHPTHTASGDPYNGQLVKGLWPHVSRTKLAHIVGKDVATISRYLNGSRQMPLEVAVPFAEIVGVTGEELLKELSRARKKWAKGRTT